MQKTLKKVLDELNKDAPRLDYIRGMLEVLVEDEALPIVGGTVNMPAPVIKPLPETVTSTLDEVGISNIQTKALLEKIGGENSLEIV